MVDECIPGGFLVDSVDSHGGDVSSVIQWLLMDDNKR